ncbi:MAG: glycyl-radical enzyme activating protein [Clostridiales bacterium]|jgi:pyruvate formate lyase activating enzyme|nr:glycyl-radical enzyme activating protein [Clostridiales bacterium]
MTEGTIFSIEEFAVFDGPGIRTAVFFKGCPLRCNWCHNPEGLERAPQVVRNPNGCLACGKCAPLLGAGKTAAEDDLCVCPRGLLRISGAAYTSGALAARLLKNADILNANGGGVTFSGGECLMQAGFLEETLERLRGKVHTAAQTSGFAEAGAFDRVIRKTDLVMFDLKVMDRALSKKYTGQYNDLILENFAALKASAAPFIARAPLIPGVTDTEENYGAILAAVKGSRALRVELLPYNKMAGGKYKLAGRKFEPMFDEGVAPRIDTGLFERNGIEASVY